MNDSGKEGDQRVTRSDVTGSSIKKVGREQTAQKEVLGTGLKYQQLSQRQEEALRAVGAEMVTC